MQQVRVYGTVSLPTTLAFHGAKCKLKLPELEVEQISSEENAQQRADKYRRRRCWHAKRHAFSERGENSTPLSIPGLNSQPAANRPEIESASKTFAYGTIGAPRGQTSHQRPTRPENSLKSLLNPDTMMMVHKMVRRRRDGGTSPVSALAAHQPISEKRSHVLNAKCWIGKSFHYSHSHTEPMQHNVLRDVSLSWGHPQVCNR
ncbi:hypothetical protein RP20_CCG022400 [Aedes albopictus]|nr:hypothetical protein RP20_CCG022400 [Aedes albopictus]